MRIVVVGQSGEAATQLDPSASESQLAIQADGTIVVVGSAGHIPDFELARYLAA